MDGIASAGAYVSGFTFDYNAFNSSWSTGIGTNDISANPNYVNSAGGDYEPQNANLLVAPKLTPLDNEERARATTTTIGAVIHES